MAVREGLPQPFAATNWTDLRVGFYISAVTAGGDDTRPTLPEAITGSPTLSEGDFWFCGIAKQGVNFLGYTNAGRPTLPALGDSKLVSSDSGVGTTNSDYWRIIHARAGTGTDDGYNLQIMEGRVIRAFNQGGWAPHVAQSATPGYATLIRLRFTRDGTDRFRSKIITMQAISTNADAVYTNTPSGPALVAALQSFPTSVIQLGPVELSQVPDQLYWYWPFHGSRLRVHARAVVKVK